MDDLSYHDPEFDRLVARLSPEGVRWSGSRLDMRTHRRQGVVMGQHDEEVRRGAAVYSRPVLGIYDLLVVRLSNTYVWRCDRARLIELYNGCVGSRHLDVGPGTGWYLANSRLPAGTAITLLDLNGNSLSRAAARIASTAPQTVVGNVLEPLPESVGPFDSIGVNYLFHCVPGTWASKGVAFGHLANRLAPGGVLFGSTILGRGVDHNVPGRLLMAFYNRRGIFHNVDDDAAGLEAALRRHFTDVKVEITGTVAAYAARQPRPSSASATGGRP